MEQLGKMGGIVAGAIAVIKYDQVIAIVERVIGSGSSLISFVIIALASVTSVVALKMGVAALHRRRNKEAL